MFIVLLLTGIFWAGLHRYGQVEGEFGPAPHPAEPWILRAHGAAAFAMLVLLGTLLPIHVKRSWKAGKNQFTGSVMLTFNFLLVLTGYGLYYAGNERLRGLTSWLHWWLGLTFPVALVWHIYAGRLSRKRLRETI
ncbi:MAG: DUF4405 domain-containing protein [Chthoniobacterales bacterium]